MTVKAPVVLDRVTPRRIVIGVGNVYRCDDGVGIVIARHIREKAKDLPVVEASGEGASLMAMWTPSDHVVIIDAVRSGSSPGRIHRLDARKEPIPSDFFNYSTHAFSVAEAVEMSRALDILPARLVIYGIEGRSFAAGNKLSQDVSEVLDEVVDRVLAELCIKVENVISTGHHAQEVPHA